MHKKPFLYFLIAFFFIQVLIDLAHSVTIFPFIHYGMYSESFKRADSLEIFEIRVNGQLLRAEDFSIAEWDRIHGPLSAMEKQEATDDFSFDKEKIRRGLGKIGLEGWWGATNFRVSNDPQLSFAFASWYKHYLAVVVKHPIQTLEIEKAWYRPANGKFDLLSKSRWITL